MSGAGDLVAADKAGIVFFPLVSQERYHGLVWEEEVSLEYKELPAAGEDWSQGLLWGILLVLWDHMGCFSKAAVSPRRATLPCVKGHGDEA